MGEIQIFRQASPSISYGSTSPQGGEITCDQALSGVRQIQRAVCWRPFNVFDTSVGNVIGVVGAFWRDLHRIMGGKL